MNRLNLIGVSVSALAALGFFSVASIDNRVEHPTLDGSKAESSSIAIYRSQIVDAETGSIVYISSLKRN